MKLSIIIPVYNVEKYIARCIDSLLTQGLDANNYEIIIVNDGSTDSSISIVENYLPHNKNIIIHNQKNQGVGAARNSGISLSKGEFIYFIDPDDYLASNVLNTLISYCDKNLEVLTFQSLGTTQSNLLQTSSNLTTISSIKITDGIEYIANNKFKNEVWWYIIKREFLNKAKVRFIEGRWMEDAIFTTTLFLKTKAIAHLPVDVHRHVKVVGSAMSSKEPKHYIKVIYDNENAAIVYNSLIQSLMSATQTITVKDCITRLKSRQQSFVFFLMVRILKSRIKLKEVKAIINNLSRNRVYPLNSFISEDYNSKVYVVLTNIFNVKYLYYVIFILLNPILRLKNN